MIGAGKVGGVLDGGFVKATVLRMEGGDEISSCSPKDEVHSSDLRAPKPVEASAVQYFGRPKFLEARKD